MSPPRVVQALSIHELDLVVEWLENVSVRSRPPEHAFVGTLPFMPIAIPVHYDLGDALCSAMSPLATQPRVESLELPVTA
jgi:hypothetical protein